MIEDVLRRESKPQMSPDFTANLMRKLPPRRRKVMPFYWAATGALTAYVCWRGDVVAAPWALLAILLLAPLSFLLALVPPRRVLAFLISALLSAAQLETFRAESVVTLSGETHHVQGIVVEGQRLWLTAVDRKASKGFLFEYELPGGKRLREVEVQSGAMFHPGGLSADSEALYVPVAEYRRESRSVIETRSKQTLGVIRAFTVADHIGAVAVAGDRLYGANWDAKTIYEWTLDGRELRRRPNPRAAPYQDMKYVDGTLVASASNGAIHWLDAATLELKREVTAGKTDRGVVYTNEGLAVAGRRLYLAPEDAPTRLFTFLLP